MQSTVKVSSYLVAVILVGAVLVPIKAVRGQATFYGLSDTAAQELVSFSYTGSEFPTLPLLSAHFITGLQASEQLLKIKNGPTPGTFYALSTEDRLYSLTTGGAATEITQFSPLLNGTAASFAVDPSSLVVTVVTNLGQEFQANMSGTLLTPVNTLSYTDTSLSGKPAIEDIALSPGPNPLLYGLDGNHLDLVSIGVAGNPSSGGGKVQVVSSGAANSPTIGFDIASDGSGFYAQTSSGFAEFAPTFISRGGIFSNTGFQPDTVGAGSFAGDLATGVPLISIAVPEPVEGMLAVVIVSLVVRRRR